ncbi:MAG: hypothetical protein MUE98_00130 [Rhodobacteraceae bacterium]|jgi:hypothetical protein|nr:hypothetical protein [Paracoccaceae bacterium]
MSRPAVLRRVIAELLTPGGDQTPYIAGVVGMAHALVGAALIQHFGWQGGAGALAMAAAYWAAKEWGDLRRGGAWRDGAQDAGFVLWGALYGPGWWPASVLALGLMVMVAREARR